MSGRTVRRSLLAVAIAASLVAVSSPSSGSGADERPHPAERLTPPARRATFAFAGEVLTHRPINYTAQQPDGSYDYSSMLDGIAPLLAWADVPICHLEQPVAPPGTAVIVGPDIHSSAASIGTALRGAGFRRCSTASNHNLDRGIAGIDATVAALTAAGVGQSGLARTPAEAIPEVFDVNGIAVAHLSYSYALGGSLAPSESWRANKIDTGRIVAAARDARARGAEVVIASMHWGDSARTAPSSYQRYVADAITAGGEIDLIVGHHAHVLQPIERVNGRWVVWGLGNFLSTMPFNANWPANSQDGAVVTVVVTRADDGTIDVERPLVYPTWVDKAHGYVVRRTTEVADLSLPHSVRVALFTSEARTRSVLGAFFAPT